MGRQGKRNTDIVIIILILVAGSIVLDSYLKSLPPNVKFTDNNLIEISIKQRQLATINVNVKNHENKTMSNVVINTSFDSDNPKFAKIQKPTIAVGDLKIDAKSGLETIMISTSGTESDGVIYNGKIEIVVGENKPSDTKKLNLQSHHNFQLIVLLNT